MSSSLLEPPTLSSEYSFEVYSSEHSTAVGIWVLLIVSFLETCFNVFMGFLHFFLVWSSIYPLKLLHVFLSLIHICCIYGFETNHKWVCRLFCIHHCMLSIAMHISFWWLQKYLNVPHRTLVQCKSTLFEHKIIGARYLKCSCCAKLSF